MDLEDKAFKEVERQIKWRKEAVLQSLHDENARLGLYKDLNPYRTQVIEEIAQHIEKMTVFGKDTVDSFAIYIRSLK
jgi:hypothetical protein